MIVIGSERSVTVLTSGSFAVPASLVEASALRLSSPAEGPFESCTLSHRSPIGIEGRHRTNHRHRKHYVNETSFVPGSSPDTVVLETFAIEAIATERVSRAKRLRMRTHRFRRFSKFIVTEFLMLTEHHFDHRALRWRSFGHDAARHRCFGSGDFADVAETLTNGFDVAAVAMSKNATRARQSLGSMGDGDEAVDARAVVRLCCNEFEDVHCVSGQPSHARCYICTFGLDFFSRHIEAGGLYRMWCTYPGPQPSY